AKSRDEGASSPRLWSCSGSLRARPARAGRPGSNPPERRPRHRPCRPRPNRSRTRLRRPEVRVSPAAGQTFPEAGLKAPIGAEKASDTEFDALRATLTAMASEFPGAASWSWRLVGQDATDTISLAQTDSIGPNGLVALDGSKSPNGWRPGNMGQCNLRVVLAGGCGPGRWGLNPGV